MKHYYSIAAKSAAMILLVLSLAICVLSIIGLVVAWDYNFFTLESKEFLDQFSLNTQTNGHHSNSRAYFEYQLLTILYNVRNFLWLFLFLSSVTSILSFIFLLSVAGKRADKEGIFESILDKIPLELLTFAIVCIDCTVIAIFLNSYYHCYTGIFALSLFLLILAFVLTVLYLCSIAVRIKMKTFLKNTILYRILRFLFRPIHRFLHFLRDLAAALPMIWKSAVFVVFLGLGAICCVAFYEQDIAYQLFSISALMLVAGFFILYLSLCFKKLSDGCDKIAKGNYNHKIDCQNMPSAFRNHGENLNSIRDGMTAAVEERMKSEHMKTELITNVSHDIKTPLTSILNYVRLLKDQPLTGDSAEYAEVLDRQSNRLKKLLDDLIEVSKASTGNITPEMTIVEANVLMEQCLGEYEERLLQKDLRLIWNQPEESLFFSADGKLMWRIFDNLMSNICKYSLSGTRVYVNLNASDDTVFMTFRNISSTELNISGEDLMQRFVRGDASRSTEGSGLGLSIAESLTGLQNGKLRIETDGDLFKVILSFPRSAAPIKALTEAENFLDDSTTYDHT